MLGGGFSNKKVNALMKKKIRILGNKTKTSEKVF